LEKFGHFFEFIAALNSAYIVSDHFVDSLMDRINGHFNLLEDLINQKNSAIQEIKKRLQKSDFNGLASKTKTDLNSKAKTLEVEIEDLKKDISEKKREKELRLTFNYWCLYGCLYCVLILLLNGFDIHFNTSYENLSFLIFNISSASILLWFLKQKKYKWTIDYCSASFNKVFFCFFGIGIIVFCSLAFLGMTEGDLLFFVNLENEHNTVQKINLVLALLLPTIHLIVILIRTKFFSKTKFKQYSVEIKKYENRIAELAITINALTEYQNDSTDQSKQDFKIKPAI
jgi:hypothetical protein